MFTNAWFSGQTDLTSQLTIVDAPLLQISATQIREMLQQEIYSLPG
jgi:nicotinic acid mononucleotide adenylyltransferase